MTTTLATNGTRIDARRGTSRVRIRSYLPSLRARRTYLNLLYLLAAFPLGTLYFIVFVTLIAIVAGSLVGLLLLPFTLASSRWTGRFERELSIWWLRLDIAPFETPLPPGTTFWDRLRIRLTDRVTWSSLAYLLLKFPFGLIAFVGVAIGLAYSAALLASPFALVYQMSVDGPPTDATGATLRAVANFALGLVVGYLLLFLSNAVTGLWGRFATFALGMQRHGAACGGGQGGAGAGGGAGRAGGAEPPRS